jgi:AcrR family transcriptional regulator
MDEIQSERSDQSDQGERIRSAYRDARSSSLVLTTYQLIAEKGFEHLRTRDIAARAGVNIATLHYYFARKEDLIPAVVEHLLFEFGTMGPGTSLEPESRSPLEQMRAMLLATYTLFDTKPEMFIVLSELVLHSLRDESIRPALQQLDDGWHTYLQFMVSAGIQQGAFRANLDASSVATRMITLIKGFFFHRITSSHAGGFDQLLDDVERLLLP